MAKRRCRNCKHYGRNDYYDYDFCDISGKIFRPYSNHYRRVCKNWGKIMLKLKPEIKIKEALANCINGRKCSFKKNSGMCKSLNEKYKDTNKYCRLCNKITKTLRKDIPVVEIGKFILYRPNKNITSSKNTIWIQTETGEGGEFDIKLLEKVIEKFYRKHF